MSDLSQTDALFYDRTGMDPEQVGGIVREALSGMDDGELFLEYSLSEGFSFDDGKLKSAAFDTAQGFGLRGVSGEATGFAHSGELSEAAIRRAGETVKAVREGRAGTLAEPPRGTNASLYTDANPLNAVPFETKVRLLAEMDSYARGRDPRVRQVMCSLSGEWRAVQIVRPDGVRVGDIRPLV
ncbi:MAG TPA: DNA gyrase modulator, partial [Stellaceae bacterium]|nr:DNA gyrase modulator [Stellaceae bacterium]